MLSCKRFYIDRRDSTDPDVTQLLSSANQMNACSDVTLHQAAVAVRSKTKMATAEWSDEKEDTLNNEHDKYSFNKCAPLQTCGELFGDLDF